jgi:predicted anti-sigma-YlaC factor YlaD
MRCELFRELILDYTTGNLGAEPLRDFKTHWTGCPACADLLRAVEGQEALLTALARPKTPAGLWMKIQSTIADRELLRRSPFNVRAVRWFLGAAAALLVVVGTAMAGRATTAPPAKDGGLNITVVDVKDRAKTGLTRFVPSYGDPVAIDAAMRELK